LGIVINDDYLTSNAVVLVSSRKSNVSLTTLNKIAIGSVAEYDVSCENVCDGKQITVKNILSKNTAFKNSLTNVQQILSVSTGVLAATLDGLYLVDNDG
jgi:hypothetical protein